jgi:hypothetical protein
MIQVSTFHCGMLKEEKPSEMQIEKGNGIQFIKLLLLPLHFIV